MDRKGSVYIIIGGSGYLGSYCIDELRVRKINNIIATSQSVKNNDCSDGTRWFSLDLHNITSIDAFIQQMNSIDAQKRIIYLAAYHNPDLVSKFPVVAWDINVTALSYLVNKMTSVETLYYISSDTVYGESSAKFHFSESDPANPINTYGRQKYNAEQIVLGLGFNVARCSFLIGRSIALKKHFYDIICDNLNEGKYIEMLSDSYRSAISFRQAASAIIEMIEKFRHDKIGIVNIAGDEILSKYDIALKIAEKEGLNRKYIVPIRMSENKFFSELRAKDILMDNQKLKKLLGIEKIKLAV